MIENDKSILNKSKKLLTTMKKIVWFYNKSIPQQWTLYEIYINILRNIKDDKEVETIV